MFKLASALVFATVAIAPAHAATAIILNPNNTSLPSFTTAAVFQDFNNAATGVRPFVPNSTIEQPPVGTESTVGTANLRDGTLTGLTGDYLALNNAGSYTIAFFQPMAFFSFAFNIMNNPGNQAYVQLNYADSTTQTFTGAAILGSPATLPNFGRVSFDTGSGPRISSVTIGKTAGANTNRFSVDDFAAAAPEPATWLMMILGFGLVGSQLRRRKTKTKVTYAAA